MKQLLLATALIALPVATFTAFNLYGGVQASVSTESLGDLSPLKTIVADVQTIAAKGDLVAAAVRITDFETSWDDSAKAMRALNPGSWGAVDDAADAALGALRAGTPKPDEVKSTLSTLLATLDDPGAGGGAAAMTATTLGGIAVTDANGRSLPCEEMLNTLRTALSTAPLSSADKTSAEAFQTKATERCNADDDQHADEFSAQGLAIATK